MQRGRGRGRNSNPARSTSRRASSTRGNRSNSRTTISRTASRSSLRRSARLAQLLDDQLHHDRPTDASNDASAQHTNGLTNGVTNHHPEPDAADSSMADVARPRALGNGSTRRHHSSRTQGLSRSGHSSASPETLTYAMDILVQPPPTAYAGQSIGGNIIVRLRILDDRLNDAVADSVNLVAVATLVRDSNWPGSRDPNVLSSLLAGRRYDTIHPFADDEADGSISSMEIAHPHGVGYMRFPELIIRQAGTYRIRITLIRIRNSSSDLPVTLSSGGVSVQAVDSNPITVQGGGASAAYYGDEEEEDDDGGWSDVLRTIQTRRWSPPR